jgi:beta-amylase
MQVYFDFMRSFHMEFGSLSEEGLISAIEIGLGACGELRYPSCPEKLGWRYPGIGEFQVFTENSKAFAFSQRKRGIYFIPSLNHQR